MNSPNNNPDPQRKARRVGFELPVRCKHGLQRNTVMLKDLTRFGARIEGLDRPEVGEPVTLLLPDQPPRTAFVVWHRGATVGLELAEPIDTNSFEALIRDYAIGQAPKDARAATLGMPTQRTFAA